MAQLGDSGVAWLDFVNPTSQELEQLKETFRLHELAIRDIVQDRQRPKVETYGATRFMVLRPARILEDRVHTLEFYLFVGPNFVITARHKDFPDLASAARDLSDAPELTRNPQQIQHVILENICHSYKPVMFFLRNAIDTLEEDIILGDETAPHRVYELARDIMKLQRGLHPFPDIVTDLREGLTGELDTHLRSLEDRALRLSGQVDGFRDALTAGLQLHTALLGQRQNEEMARIPRPRMTKANKRRKSQHGQPSCSPRQ